MDAADSGRREDRAARAREGLALALAAKKARRTFRLDAEIAAGVAVEQLSKLSLSPDKKVDDEDMQEHIPVPAGMGVRAG